MSGSRNGSNSRSGRTSVATTPPRTTATPATVASPTGQPIPAEWVEEFLTPASLQPVAARYPAARAPVSSPAAVAAGVRMQPAASYYSPAAPVAVPAGPLDTSSPLPLQYGQGRKRTNIERYFQFLVFVLTGYAIFGRGFAYIGAPPLFIGEMALGLG